MAMAKVRPNGRPRAPKDDGSGKKLTRAYVDAGDNVSPGNMARPYGGTLATSIQSMADAIVAGATIGEVCAAAGFSRQALYAYRQRHPEADALIRSAEAARDRPVSRSVYQAAQEDWRAGFRWLETHQPEDWAPPASRVELSGRDGGPIALEAKRAEAMPDRELAAYARELARELDE